MNKKHFRICFFLIPYKTGNPTINKYLPSDDIRQDPLYLQIRNPNPTNDVTLLKYVN